MDGDCAELANGLWSCKVQDSVSSGAAMTVKTKTFGSWEAWTGDRPIERREPSDSGCIDVLDVL